MNSSKKTQLLPRKIWKELKQKSETEKTIAIDTETTGLNTYDPTVVVTHISWWDSDGEGDVIEIGDNHDEEKYSHLKKICADKDKLVLMFNAKYDIQMLKKLGFVFRCTIIDVMVVAQLTVGEEKLKNLKHLTRKFLKDPYLEELEMKKWSRQNNKAAYGLAPKHIVYPYAIADARRTLELFYYFMPALDKMKLWETLAFECKLMPHVLNMENNGIPVDQDVVDSLTIKINEELKSLKDDISVLTGRPDFNPNSNPQVANAVYDGSVMPTRFSKKTGQPQVDELSLLEHPSKLGSLVVQFRKLTKAKSTYLKNFKHVDTNGNIHPAFHQCGARTGRFSSSGPNFQNIPRKSQHYLGHLRKCIRIRENECSRLVFIDYSQIELRLTAHYSGQDHMLDSIRNGYDLHGVTCEVTFGKTEGDDGYEELRYLGKTLNFAVIYGTGADTYRTTVLKDTNGSIKLSDVEAANHIATYKSNHPKIEELFARVIDEVSRTGGVVNFYGRFMPVDKRKPYVGVNYIIQGTAAYFMKKKMLSVCKYLRKIKARTKLIMTIHDELVFIVPLQEKHLIKKIALMMEDHDTFDVPLTTSVSIGENWLDKKEIRWK